MNFILCSVHGGVPDLKNEYARCGNIEVAKMIRDALNEQTGRNLDTYAHFGLVHADDTTKEIK